MSTNLAGSRTSRRFVKCARTSSHSHSLLIKHAAQPDLDGDMGDSKGLQLSQFEMAQLANLSVSDIDEARTLIPTYVLVADISLASKDDAQLESLLNELSAIWKFA